MEKFTQINKINETSVMPDINMGTWMAKAGPVKQYALGANPPENNIEQPAITKSEPCKFVSKIFESRQMAHVYHLQAKGEGSYALHMALDEYYKNIIKLNDELIEVYQGQYDILEDYEIIETADKPDNAIQYFIEVAEFIKSTRKVAFVEEDTHLQNIIDGMVALLYKTLYKLKNLK